MLIIRVMAQIDDLDLPFRVVQVTERLGQLVNVARRSRRWTQADLAAKAGCSVSTVASAERGDPRLAMYLWLKVLWATGQLERLDAALDPELDAEGVKDLQAQLPKRIRRSSA